MTRSRNHSCSGNASRIFFFFFFFNIYHKGHDFRENIEHTSCVLLFSKILSVTFLIPCRVQKSIITNVRYVGLHVVYLLLLSDFESDFLYTFSNNTENIKFHENPSTGSRVVACRRTDKTKPAVAFHDVAKKKPQNMFRVQFYFASFSFNFYLKPM